MALYIYSQSTLSKVAKTTQWERIIFQQMLLGQLDIHIERNKFGPPTAHIQIYTNKLKMDQIPKAKTVILCMEKCILGKESERGL